MTGLATRPGCRAGGAAGPARRVLFLLLALPLLAGFGGLAFNAGPDADLLPHWQAQDPDSAVTVDHAPWQRFLDRYLRPNPAPGGPSLVAYGAVTPTDREALRRYIDGLAGLPVTALTRADQFAYWVNLYNALTVDLVLSHYPVATIRDIDISPGLFADGPWGRTLVTVEGRALSLDDIEHGILRPIWQDPRIHYAVNCASIGCPALQGRAFTAANAEALLRAGAEAYVNSPRGARFDADGALTVSSLYDWYAVDFGNGAAGVLAHLRRHAAPALLAQLDGVTGIADTAYDWRLNDAGGGR